MLDRVALSHARAEAERFMTSEVIIPGTDAITRDANGKYVRSDSGSEVETTGNLVGMSTSEASSNQRTNGKTSFHLFTPWNAPGIPAASIVLVDGKSYQVVGELGPPSDDVIQRDTVVFLD